MSKTEDALKEAFAGESQANRKYLAFAAKAVQEGDMNGFVDRMNSELPLSWSRERNTTGYFSQERRDTQVCSMMEA